MSGAETPGYTQSKFPDTKTTAPNVAQPAPSKLEMSCCVTRTLSGAEVTGYQNRKFIIFEIMPETEELLEVKTLQSEERQTIVHCSCDEVYAYRIWPTAYLVERGTGKSAKLITAFNISFAPQWTLNDGKGFTLIFEGLSRECSSFDLREIIPQENGFEVLGIKRNNTDVYQVRF